MDFYTCTRCKKTKRSRTEVSPLRKYCRPCAVSIRRESVRKTRALRPEYYRRKAKAYYLAHREEMREYYRNRSKQPGFNEWAKERHGRIKFARDLEKRVELARQELDAHLKFEPYNKPMLDSCNICIIRQGKYDCALKLYEANLVERDASHGDKPVAPKCAIQLVRPVIVTPETLR